MFLGAFLIGLREGMEAALIIGILIAFVQKRRVQPNSIENHLDQTNSTSGSSVALRGIWWGVGVGVLLSVLLGALFTYSAYTLTFRAQEIIGGSMSILAVVLVTWMVFWMAGASKNIRTNLEAAADRRLSLGRGGAMFGLSFITVGREGIETTLLLWGWALQPVALVGALTGICCAAVLGWLIYRGMIRLNLSVFFFWTGLFLVVVAAGILAYGIHDLQEAGVLPGPFSGPPITPTDFRTGEVMTGFFTPIPYWGVAFPFGWAFNVSDTIAPDGPLASILKGTVGFTPQMSWLEVSMWFIYMLAVLPRFVRKMGANKTKPNQNAPGREPELSQSLNSENHIHAAEDECQSPVRLQLLSSLRIVSSAKKITRKENTNEQKNELVDTPSR